MLPRGYDAPVAGTPNRYRGYFIALNRLNFSPGEGSRQGLELAGSERKHCFPIVTPEHAGYASDFFNIDTCQQPPSTPREHQAAISKAPANLGDRPMLNGKDFILTMPSTP